MSVKAFYDKHGKYDKKISVRVGVEETCGSLQTVCFRFIPSVGRLSWSRGLLHGRAGVHVSRTGRAGAAAGWSLRARRMGRWATAAGQGWRAWAARVHVSLSEGHLPSRPSEQRRGNVGIQGRQVVMSSAAPGQRAVGGGGELRGVEGGGGKRRGERRGAAGSSGWSRGATRGAEGLRGTAVCGGG